MPVAEMISGTIIGEISRAMRPVLNGISERLSPSAARVPRNVEIRVAKIAMTRLFWTASCQDASVKNSRYHLVLYPAGSSDSISGVKVK